MSNDSKHTPGSLAVGYYTPTPDFRAVVEHVAVMRAGDGGLIAVCGPLDSPMSELDARLFAAAPDMLDALRLALDYCESGAVEDSIPGTLSETIRAAIAAATGATP